MFESNIWVEKGLRVIRVRELNIAEEQYLRAQGPIFPQTKNIRTALKAHLMDKVKRKS